MASAQLGEELSCSICLNIYTDPVMLRCGHNYCRGCIDHVLDTQEASRLYSCPECREEFQERPVLYNARALRNIAEKFLTSQPDQKEKGIFCTYCVDSPVPAVKSCLQCESSMCDKHLRVHVKSPEHVLSEPTDSPGNRKCPLHKKIEEYYCTKERVSICVYCIAIGDHKGHQVESLDEAFKKKKEKLRKDLEIMPSKKTWADQQIQSLRKRRLDVQERAAGVTRRVADLFREAKRELEELETGVLSQICKQEEKISMSISEVIERLEIQKDELSRKMSHLEKVYNTTDMLSVLKDQTWDGEELGHSEQDMDTMVPSEGDFHEYLVTDGLRTISAVIKDLHLWVRPASVVLDDDTAAPNIQTSGDLRTASRSAVLLNRPATPNRFKANQVQSRSSFSSGRHHWEVDTSRSTSWRVGLCYPSMDRKSYVGENKDSWCLRRCNVSYNEMHENRLMPLLHNPTSHRFRISLDYEAGRISFYELSDPTRQHLHTFTTTFTEPLHLVISLWNGSIEITN